MQQNSHKAADDMLAWQISFMTVLICGDSHISERPQVLSLHAASTSRTFRSPNTRRPAQRWRRPLNRTNLSFTKHQPSSAAMTASAQPHKPLAHQTPAVRRSDDGVRSAAHDPHHLQIKYSHQSPYLYASLSQKQFPLSSYLYILHNTEVQGNIISQ